MKEFDEERGEIEYFDEEWNEMRRSNVADDDRCESCGESGWYELHGCPYAEEVAGDYSKKCNCWHLCETDCCRQI